MRPHLVSTDELVVQGRRLPSDGEWEVHVALAEETVDAVADALYGVVNEGGTGGRARIPGLDVGGKTGTAQVASLATARAAEEAGNPLKDNAWFVGLAPRRNPEIVVVVLYESGEHGYLAAPLAREVMKAYFDKKKGLQPQMANREEPGAQPAAALSSGDPIGG